MFCRESSFSSLQTLNIAKSLSSMFPNPSALIKPSAGHPDKLCGSNLGERCKVKASRSNIDQKCQIVKQTVKKIKVKGYITSQEGLLDGLAWSRGLDDIADIAGRSLLVELISSETDLGEYIFCQQTLLTNIKNKVASKFLLLVSYIYM